MQVCLGPGGKVLVCDLVDFSDKTCRNELYVKLPRLVDVVPETMFHWFAGRHKLFGCNK